MLIYMVERGLDIHLPAQEGDMNALHIAVLIQNVELVEYLAAQGVDAQATNCDGNSAIDIARIFKRDVKSEQSQKILDTLEAQCAA